MVDTRLLDVQRSFHNSSLKRASPPKAVSRKRKAPLETNPPPPAATPTRARPRLSQTTKIPSSIATPGHHTRVRTGSPAHHEVLRQLASEFLPALGTLGNLLGTVSGDNNQSSSRPKEAKRATIFEGSKLNVGAASAGSNLATTILADIISSADVTSATICLDDTDTTALVKVPHASPSGVQEVDLAFFLKDVLFEPRSTVPRKTINLTAWVPHLLDPLLLARIVQDNPTFTGVVIKGPSQDVNGGLLQHLGQYFVSRGIYLQDVDFSQCELISDRGLLNLLEVLHPRGLRSIRLNSCPKVTDRGLASISKHCPDLRCLEVAQCIDCTSNGFGLVIPRCPRLVGLSVAHCPQITDRFLHLLCEHLTLESLDISYCPSITENGVASFFTSAQRLLSFKAQGNRALTDAGMKTMHEVPVVYGTKKGNGCSCLKQLILDDCAELTPLSTAFWLGDCFNIQELSLQRCISVVAGKGAENIGNMNSLTKLDLTGCSKLDESALQALASASEPPPLVWLSLDEIGRLTDRGLDCITTAFPLLQYLSLDKNPRVTDQGVNYLAARCTKIHTLRMRELPLLTDKGIMFLAITRRRIHHLYLDYCSRLTDGCMEGFSEMQELETLSLMGCGNITDQGVSWLVSRCLVTLRLGHLPRLTDQGLQSLAAKMPRLQHVDVSSCQGLTPSGLETLLSSMQNLRDLNVTGCGDEVEEWVKYKVRRSAEQLTAVVEDKEEFVGFRLSDQLEDARVRMLQKAAKEDGAARMIQHWFRTVHIHRKYVKDKAERLARMDVAVIMIQAAFRRYHIQRRLRLVRKAWKRFLPIFRVRVNGIWLKRAATYHTKKKEQEALQRLQLFAKHARIAKARDAANSRAKQLWSKNHLHKFLKAWREFTEEEVMKHLESQIADRHFYAKMKPVLFELWKAKTKRRRAHREFMINIFLQAMPAYTWNSSAQALRLQLADDYRGAVLLSWIWPHMKRFLAEQTPLKARRAMAMKLYRKNFLNHFMRHVVEALRLYAQDRINKKRLKARGEEHWVNTAKYSAMQKFRMMGKIHKYKARRKERKRHWAIIKFTKHSDYRAKKKVWMAEVATVIAKFATVMGHARLLRRLEAYYYHRRERREYTLRARRHFSQTITLKMFNNWSHFRDVVKRKMELIERLGDRRLKQRVFETMVQNVLSDIQERLEQQAAEREAQRIAEEARLKFERETKAATKIQALWRGVKTRRETEEWKNFRDWAVLKVQQQMRVWLAKRHVQKRRKYRYLASVLQEEREEGLMRLEDELSYQLRKWYNAINLINRFFRGCLGRRLAFRRRQEVIRQRNFAINVTMRQQAVERAERLTKEREAEERLRERAAVSLQCLVRGVLARLLAAKLRYRRDLVRSTIRMQAVYRRVLARRKAAARRRHLDNVRVTRAVRKTQGRILRMLRFSNRYQQRRFTDFLGRIGLDPRHYQLNRIKQIEEIKQDYRLAIKELQLERAVWKHGRLDAMERKRYRGEHQESYLPVVEIINRDAVRVILRCVVIRVDRETPHKPVAEVKMDHDGKYYYLPFARDDRTSNFAIVDKMEKPFMDWHKVRQNEENLVGWAEKEIQRRIPERAAITIQKSFRCHMGAKYVASFRYDYWNKIRRKRYAILNFLDSMGGYNARNTYYLEYLNIFDRLELPQPSRNTLIPPELQERQMLVKRQKIANAEYKKRKLIRKFYVEERRDKIASNILSLYREYSTARVLRSQITFPLTALILGGGGYKRNLAGFIARLIAGKDLELTEEQRRTWVGKYVFKQFELSPHARAGGLTMYHGTWKGRPGTDRFVPHGEGIAEFFDCWGVVPEERTLHIKLIKARNLLPAPVGISNIYVMIECNKKKLTSKVVSGTSPTWEEDFKVDVSYPEEWILFTVYDYDGRFKHEFEGRVSFQLKRLPYKEKVTTWYKLVDQKGRATRDLGEIQVELLWDEIHVATHIDELNLQNFSACKLQAWWRITFSRHVADRARQAQVERVKLVTKQVIKLQGFGRIIKAKEDVRRRRLFCKGLKKFQRAMRRLRCVRVFTHDLKFFKATRTIQCMFRCWKARKLRNTLFEEFQKRRNKCASNLQKHVRRQHCRRVVDRMRKEAKELGIYVPMAKCMPVARWLPHYGTDPPYPTKRSARICRRVIKGMLVLQGTTIMTPYGEADVERYPAEATDWRGDPTKMVELYLRGYRVNLRASAAERRAVREACPMYKATFHIDTGINILGTVNAKACRIQCCIRAFQARRQVAIRRRRRNAARKIQRAFRHRAAKQEHAVKTLQRYARQFLARCRLAFKKKEVECAVKLQCAFRCLRARQRVEKMRIVKDVTAIACSSRLDGHFAAIRTVDGAPDTFWLSKKGKKYNQWITYDLQRDINLSKLIMVVPGGTSVPKNVVLKYSPGPKGPFKPLHEFVLHTTQRPQHIKLPGVQEATVRYWRIHMLDNHGGSSGLSITNVYFIPRQPERASVTTHPDSTIIAPGPDLDGRAEVTLTCTGAGWPPPTYQWRFEGEDIPGATNSTITIVVEAQPKQGNKFFRCSHCHKVNTRVPVSCFRLVCSNCKTPYDFPEYTQGLNIREEAYIQMEQLDNKLGDLRQQRTRVAADLEIRAKELDYMPDKGSKEEMSRKVKLSEMVRSLAHVVRELDESIHAQSLIKAQYLRRRLDEEASLDKAKVTYQGEGEYTCVVSNVRDNMFNVEAVSRPAVIYVQLPVPMDIRVHDVYKPRRQLRRKLFEKYGTISGFFTKGRVEGDVFIRFKSGHTYEGPYVDETLINHMGLTDPQRRSRDHWGRWVTPDGWIFEGNVVDNHFDLSNKQGELRRISPTKEEYEGTIVDDEPHGMGEMRYPDGSRYVGEFFRGVRQGFGTLIMPDGSSFEGEWDRNVINGEGIWRWRDGSSYVGANFNGKRHGRGVYISALKDTYIGQFVENRVEGDGAFTYRDGSKYVGHFLDNLRHGLGSYTNAKGITYIGSFVHDKQHGVFVVRRPVPSLPGEPEWGDEVQKGEWDLGRFVRWVDIPTSPKATYQFCNMFEDSEEEYDGAYALLVAKNLPFLPNGVEPDNPRVKRILQRIGGEAGELCGKDTLIVQFKKLETLLPEQEKLSEEYRKSIAKTASAEGIVQNRYKEMVEAETKVKILQQSTDDLAHRIESYWASDLTASRELFQESVKRLAEVDPMEWSNIRQYLKPPPMVFKVMMAACIILKRPENWETAKILLGDHHTNYGIDEVALIDSYDLKIVSLMNKHNVFDYTREEEMLRRVEDIIRHPRFTSDNLAIANYGRGLPRIVDWLKALFAYTRKSEGIIAVHEELLAAKDKTIRAEYVLQNAVKICKEVKEQYASMKAAEEVVHNKLLQVQEEVNVCQGIIAQCEALVTQYQPPAPEPDYYQKKLEVIDQDDHVKFEVVIESLLVEVENRSGRRAKPMEVFDIRDHIKAEIGTFREQLFIWRQEGGQDGKLLEDKREALLADFFCVVLADMNRIMREDDEYCQEWCMLDGKVYKADFVMYLIRKTWAELDYKEFEQYCCQQWEEAFPGEAAKMAVQARTSYMMTTETKEQGRIWELYHQAEVREAEIDMADAYELAYPNETARSALGVVQDPYPYGPHILAQATIWMKLNPKQVKEAELEVEQEKADVFYEKYPDDTAAEYLEIMKDKESYAGEVIEAAEAWSRLHMVEVAEEEERQLQALADNFEHNFPYDTPSKAAEMIYGLGMDVTDDQLEEAKAWGLFHPKEAKMAVRLVTKHIQNLYEEKTKLIKSLQCQRRVYQDQLEKARKAPEDDEEAADMVEDMMEALQSVETDLIEAHLERVDYCKHRISECRDKLKRAEADRSYLWVSNKVRPSERQPTLDEQKKEHEQLMQRYGDEIVHKEKLIKSTMKELESMGYKEEDDGQDGFKLEEDKEDGNDHEDPGRIGAASSGNAADWAPYYDGTSARWYYYNNKTGESRWA